jgi:uncharacterized membrane protein YgcG
MKNLIKLPAILLGLLLLLTGTTQKAMAQNEDVSLQSFYDELSPYGTWIQDPEYGYVWRPDVDQDEFRPYYTNGRWAMTEYGNTWVSNYDWGWAPFHYGRWIYNRYNNWIWLPDTVWGPAWVNWRSGGGNYGWAPMGPTIGIHINIGRSYRIPDMCWNFVPYDNIYYSSYPRYNGYRNNVYIQNTVIINNTYVRGNRTYYTGPRADEIRRYTNRDVTVYNVNRVSRGGRTTIANNNINIYQPRPSRGGDNSRVAPRNAVSANVRTQVIGRDNTVSSRPSRVGDNNFGRNADRLQSNRPGRGSDVNSTPSRGTYTPQGDRNNGQQSNRPSRGSEINRTPTTDGRISTGQRPENTTEGNRTRILERPNRGSDVSRGSEQQNQRAERQPAQQAPPQRTQESRPQPQQQMPAQRMERPQAQPRVERSGGFEQRGGGESRQSRGGGGNGNNGGGGGRPSRGGRG